MYSFTRRSTGRITPTRKLVKKGSSLRDLRPLTERVVLEKVLGVTVNGNSGLACNPVSGDIAYAAGCVIVLLGFPPQCQSHIVNSSRKTVSSLAFSPDGKHLVSGESGHQPAVRVWDAEDSTHPQISEMTKGHKHGIQCVAFSPNMKYVVSVGFQHDMLVNIWNWREGTTIACNKVSSKVSAISFSEKGDYFVTAGVRIVKFWYIDSDSANKAKKKIPLLGRPAILGEKRNNHFIDVACGLGVNSSLTYCVTKSGLLCSFNEKRLLDKWVELRVNGAYSLTVNEQFIFCGCSDGVIRAFSSSSLQFIGTLPKPHCLGVDVAAGLDASHLLTKVENATYPDTVALTLDPQNSKLTCVYNDHSIYIWDIKDIKKIGKVSSFLYHSSCVWGIEVYPENSENHQAALPYGSFLTCSSDGTVRVWNIETGTNMMKNIYSKELMRILYTEKELTWLKDTKGHSETNRKESEIKPGVRCLKLCHGGQQLATGDRMGNIRVFDLTFMDELIKIEAHESEILCIEYSDPDSGYKLLGSAGRDRLIHVFDCENNFNLLQTIDDHSASITSVKFNVSESKDFQLISCAADKSVIFRSAQKDPDLQFSRYTNVATKATFYDMDIHPSRNYTVTAGQDRNLRVFDISSGKQIRSFKGSMGDDGLILKVLLDRSGFYAATSCSDKSLSLYDFEMGECVAGMVGHSEVVTGLQFSVDCKRLITVSGDGCIFVWKLPSAFAQNMSERLTDFGGLKQDISPVIPRRETYEIKNISQVDGVVNDQDFGPSFNGESSPPDEDYRFSLGKLPLWAKKQIANHENMDTTVITETIQTSTSFTAATQPAGKWAERFNQVNLKIQPDSPSSESPERRRLTAEFSALNEHVEALARTPLEKRCSNGSLNEEEMFFQDASVALRFLKEDSSQNADGVPSTVNTTRGSDIFLETIETRAYVESSLAKDSTEPENETETDSKEEQDIIYYPNEEDLDSEVANLNKLSSNITTTKDLDKETSKDPGENSTLLEPERLLNSENNTDINPCSKSEIIKETQTINQEGRTRLKKRTIEDILRSPSDSEDIEYFEMRAGPSMDNLVIHEAELTSPGRYRSEEWSPSATSYDVKIRQDSDEEKDIDNQNTESISREDADEKTGDSLSDEEDLFTKEIIPKWDELSEEPAPTVGRADFENSKEFFVENFECLGSTPTCDKNENEFDFTGSPEAVPTEPSPFDRNSFQRTSISARFILRSKQSSLRSVTTATSQSTDDESTETKDSEREKRKRELDLTKKRLEALGFKALDNWNKSTKRENEPTEDGLAKTKTDIAKEKQDSSGIDDRTDTPSWRKPTVEADKPGTEIQKSATTDLLHSSSTNERSGLSRDHIHQTSFKIASSSESSSSSSPRATTVSNNSSSSSLQTKVSPAEPLENTLQSTAQKDASSVDSTDCVTTKVIKSPKGTVISSLEITNVFHFQDTKKSPEREKEKIEKRISSQASHSPSEISTKSSEVESGESPTKRASELIAFFDPRQKNKAKQETKTNAEKRLENESQLQGKSDRKPKKEDASEKVPKHLRPGKLSLLTKAGEKNVSHGRRSFPLNITRLTKNKNTSRGGSKGDLLKAKSCGDLLQEQIKETSGERTRRKSESKEDSELRPEIKKHVELEKEIKEDVEINKPTKEDIEVKIVIKEDESIGSGHSLKGLSDIADKSRTDYIPNKTSDSDLSELSAELNAALATPAPKQIQINLSRDYLLDGNNLTPSFSRLAPGKTKELSDQITKSECREVVVDLVRAFERALECHSKILQGDIQDDQQQVLSMLSATFSTIQESVIECKRDREQKTRSPRSRMLEQRPSAESNISGDRQTKDASQQTEHSFSPAEREKIVPLLDKYSELLLEKLDQRLKNTHLCKDVNSE